MTCLSQCFTIYSSGTVSSVSRRNTSTHVCFGKVSTSNHRNGPFIMKQMCSKRSVDDWQRVSRINFYLLIIHTLTNANTELALTCLENYSLPLSTQENSNVPIQTTIGYATPKRKVLPLGGPFLSERSSLTVPMTAEDS